jgi:hypothetical protein
MLFGILAGEALTIVNIDRQAHALRTKAPGNWTRGTSPAPGVRQVPWEGPTGMLQWFDEGFHPGEGWRRVLPNASFDPGGDWKRVPPTRAMTRDEAIAEGGRMSLPGVRQVPSGALDSLARDSAREHQPQQDDDHPLAPLAGPVADGLGGHAETVTVERIDGGKLGARRTWGDRHRLIAGTMPLGAAARRRTAHPRRGPAHRRQHRQATGAACGEMALETTSGLLWPGAGPLGGERLSVS